MSQAVQQQTSMYDMYLQSSLKVTTTSEVSLVNHIQYSVFNKGTP